MPKKGINALINLSADTMNSVLTLKLNQHYQCNDCTTQFIRKNHIRALVNPLSLSDCAEPYQLENETSIVRMAVRDNLRTESMLRKGTQLAQSQIFSSMRACAFDEAPGADGNQWRTWKSVIT